jgi:RNA polymerase primary sigma factor
VKKNRIDLETLEKAIYILPEREKQVIKMLYGLFDIGKYNYREIGEHFNVSRDRIRQIEKKALKTLNKYLTIEL